MIDPTSPTRRRLATLQVLLIVLSMVLTPFGAMPAQARPAMQTEIPVAETPIMQQEELLPVEVAPVEAPEILPEVLTFEPALAPLASTGQCMVDRYNQTKPAKETSLNCSSNDVQLATYTLISGPTSCLPGEVITVGLKGEFLSTAQDRYDVGVFVGTDGGTPNRVGGTCYNDFLHYASTNNNTDLNLTGGSGPFYNAETGAVPAGSDTCGDIAQGNNAFLTISTISLVCQDSDGNGTADVGSCTVWANSSSLKTTDPKCTSELNTTAETTAKCTCANVPISGLSVPKTGTIKVDKVLSPSNDPGKFNLQIDGVTKASDVGDGGSTGAVTVSAGNVPPGTGASHTVGETGGTGTDLANYNSSISCTKLGLSSPDTDGTITVLPNDAWTCTITNTPKTGTLIVNKTLVNDNSGTKACTDFSFTVDGATAVPFDSDCSNSVTVLAGSHTVVEVGIPIDGYTTTDSNCTSVNVPAGGTATCTITNDDVAVPGMTVDKSSMTTILSAPGTVTYDYLVTNTGNTTLTGIALSDNNDNDDLSCPYTTLAAGTSMTCHATHTFTQAELDAGGTLDNTVTADSNETEPVTDSLSIPISQTAAINVEKSSTTTSITAAGQVVPYTFVVTNAGNVTLTGITVTDPMCDADPVYGSGDANADGKLQVSESWTYTCSHTVTQAEIDVDGNLSNTVTADSNESAPVTDTLDIPIVRTAAINVEKSSTTASITAAGQVVPYTFVVTNADSVTLTGITVTDPKCDAAPAYVSGDANADGKLQVTETWTYTCNHTVTQAEVDAGGNLINTVTADSNESAPDTDDHAIPVTQSPALTIDKTATPTTYDAVGDVIGYSYLVTNSGNVTLYNITVVDDKATVTCPDTSAGLAPAGAITCSASYTITQADLDSGSVTNTAYAKSGNTQSAPDSETVTAVPMPALSLVKTATPTTYDSVGDVISYSYLVKNTGNVTLAGPITVTDDKATVSCPAGGLAPNAEMTCTASYTITQADLDAGSVTNTAQAHANGTDSNYDDETVTADKMPALTIVKTATPATYDAVGDVISYSYLVTNSGNVTLYDLTVVDDKATVTCPDTSAGLAPLGQMTCTASYTITQADLDSGSVTNTAYATDGTTQSEPDSETVTADKQPALTIVKTATPKTYDAVGAVISYSYLVTNSGNVTLYNISVVDDKATVTCPDTSAGLAPLGTVTCTASYTITQADLDAGSVTNTAYATDGTTQSEPDSETVTADQNPHLAISKVATETSYDSVGDVLNYTIVATNDGNVTLTAVTVSDPLVSELTCTPANGSALAPGESMTCTATHTVTQADLDAGHYANTACVDDGIGGADQQCASANPPADQKPHLAIAKSVDPTSFSKVGDILTYTIVATNDGNVTLKNVTVSDPNVTGLTCTPANGSDLAPGASMTCTGTHTVTQADLDAGHYANTACVDDGADGAAQQCASKDTPGTQTPHITLVKTAITENFDAAGDVLYYELVATNDGNVTLTNVTISDPKLGSLTCEPAQPATLPPGETLTCQGSYTALQSDVDFGSFYNVASTEGTPPTGADVTDTDDETVPALQNPAIDIVKTTNGMDGGSFLVGSTINWKYVVKNTGNVTLSNIAVTDNKGVSVTCPADTLAVGESMTCTATGTATLGLYENTGTVTADDPQGDDATDSDDSSYFGADPEIDVEKFVSIDGGTTWVDADTATGPYLNAGTAPQFKFVVTNTGNVALSSVTVTDSDFTLPAGCVASTLAVGASDDCIVTGTWAAGQHSNTANASGSFTDDANKTETDTDTDDANYFGADPKIDLTKTGAWVDGNANGFADVGEKINYSFVVKNTGNVALSSVTVTDPKVSLISCPKTTLAVNESMTCTGSYTLTLADIYAGKVDNTATAYGSFTDDNNNTKTVNDPASATVTLPLEPTGQIRPTQTTCQQFRDGTGQTMQQYYPPYGYVYYGLKGKNINNVNPGVYFYYTEVTLAGGQFTIDVTQSNNKGWPKIPVQVGENIVLWDSTCTKVQGLTAAYDPATGNATISGNVTAGVYYLSVKWEPNSLRGYQPTGKPMVTYSYQAYLTDSGYTGPIASSGASQIIAPKK